jgi:hypothetical protein
MPNPYKIYDRNQGPPWLKQLDKYIEVPESNPYKILDNEAVIRNRGGGREILDKATYVERASGGRIKRDAGGQAPEPIKPAPSQEETEYNRELALRLRNVGRNGRLPPTSRSKGGRK